MAVPLGEGQSSGIGDNQAVEDVRGMSEEEQAAFAEEQGWVVDTALEMDAEQKVIPGQEDSIVDNVIKALENSGVELSEETRKELAEKIKEAMGQEEETPRTEDNYDDDDNDDDGLSSEARLSSLGLSQGSLSPVFNSDITSYTASVSNEVTSITISPTVQESNATVIVNGTTVVSASPVVISLDVGTNTIDVVVTAEDGVTSKTYTVTVNRIGRDVSGDFTDANFKQAVWEWLGNEIGSAPGNFTQQDLSNRMAVQSNILDVSGKNISNLAGLENFQGTGLLELHCGSNNLNNLPNLPSGLECLGCGDNNLSGLPTLPSSLISLRCGNNNISSLPVLPSILTILWLSDNSLNSLPDLPDSLTTLWCSNNNLNNLPALPSSLTELKCHNNQLSSLPNLPVGLTYLGCCNNSLNSLPDLPPDLTTLWCSENSLSSLPALPNTLTSLYCAWNNLSNIDVPAQFTELHCNNNYLDVFTDPLMTLINDCACSDETRQITPQYKYVYAGDTISFVSGETRQLTGSELERRKSSDGSSWTGPTAGVIGDFTFSSSNIAVATVDSGGLINAAGIGSCEIYAKYKNIDSGYTKVTIPVTVTGVATVATVVNSTKANGSYGIDEVIPISVSFDQVVYVTGTPQMSLATGTPSATYIDYSEGSGTSTLIFNYTVAEGNYSVDLAYTSPAAISLNGGSIKNETAEDAVLTLPTPGTEGSLSWSKDLVIDGVKPKITAAAFTNSGGGATLWDAVGETLTITFSEDVTITAGQLSDTQLNALLGTSIVYDAASTVNIAQGLSNTARLTSSGAAFSTGLAQDAAVNGTSHDSSAYLIDMTGNTLGATTGVILELGADVCVESLDSYYTIDDSANTIQSNVSEINTNLTVEAFFSCLSKNAQAEWKVIAEGITVSNQSEFDGATAKSSADTLLFGDQLAVKAEDGTIKVYAVSVLLGDPVLGGGDNPGTPSGLKSPFSGFTWGKYRYWLYDFIDNSISIKIIAYDESNQIISQWDKSGGRYTSSISIDTTNETIIITNQYGTMTVNWSELLLTQP